MKINVKAFAMASSVFWTLFVSLCIWISILGIGDTPFNFVDQLYLGWLSSSFFGFIYGAVFALVDGLIGGALMALLYNKLATD